MEDTTLNYTILKKQKDELKKKYLDAVYAYETLASNVASLVLFRPIRKSND